MKDPGNLLDEPNATTFPFQHHTYGGFGYRRNTHLTEFFEIQFVVRNKSENKFSVDSSFIILHSYTVLILLRG